MGLSIEVYAVILLIVRLISMGLMWKVIQRQWSLFKKPIDESIKNFRKLLFVIALAIVAGNITPMVIDVLTIFATTDRPPFVSLTSLAYTFNAAGTALLSSYLIWRLYKLADDEEAITEYTSKHINK